ncbi:MAG TPA: hypothetical protein VKE50_09600 [Thermoanaerobaculia bacterium]|nr:hypothetical protein [Thermoanaerobaculia bacterium]
MDRSVPTYEDAQLILKLYELRRDEKMREARAWFGKFLPVTIADVKAVSASSGPENAYYRMVTSYWEMAASFVVRGVLNLDLFLDSGGEMVFVWARLSHLIPQIRSELGTPTFWSNVEQVIQMSPRAQERAATLAKRNAAAREQTAVTAAR